MPAKAPKKEIRYLDISGIDNKSHRVVDAKTYLGATAPSRARQLVQEDDILFSTVRTYLKHRQGPTEYSGQIHLPASRCCALLPQSCLTTFLRSR